MHRIKEDGKMIKIVYIVIACAFGDSFYHIDSVWTSLCKARKRCNELNSKGGQWLVDNWGCGLFDVELEIIKH